MLQSKNGLPMPGSLRKVNDSSTGSCVTLDGFGWLERQRTLNSLTCGFANRAPECRLGVIGSKAAILDRRSGVGVKPEVPWTCL
jgi:hypothetical protein